MDGAGDDAFRPFRFSLQMTRIRGRKAWMADARRAEELGYDLLLTADHLTVCTPPLVALVAAAQSTTTLRLGTLVVNNDLRPLSLLAREAVAVDVLSDGRFELGIGAGYAADEYQRAGLRFDTAALRIERMAEAASLLRRLLDGETVTHAGRHYQLDGECCELRPVQRRVPLMIGGGSRATLDTAAALADTVCIASTGRARRAATVDRQVAHIRAACDLAGRRPEVQLLLSTALVSPAPADVEATLRPRPARPHGRRSVGVAVHAGR